MEASLAAAPTSAHMKLAFFALLLGITIGYFYGFDDARHHDKNVVSRTVDRVGGKNRGRYANDIDKQADAVTR
jgi:hypothetical protein